jgi:hypothetical protein
MKFVTPGTSFVLGVTAVLGSVAIAAARPTPPVPSAMQTLQVDVRVEPQRPNFEIKLADKNKPVNVCIMGTGLSLDFGLIDQPTLEFAGTAPNSMTGRRRDCDSDGKQDMSYPFTTSKLKVTPTDTLACLDAKLTDGRSIRGCAKIKVVP